MRFIVGFFVWFVFFGGGVFVVLMVGAELFGVMFSGNTYDVDPLFSLWAVAWGPFIAWASKTSSGNAFGEWCTGN